MCQCLAQTPLTIQFWPHSRASHILTGCSCKYRHRKTVLLNIRITIFGQSDEHPHALGEHDEDITKVVLIVMRWVSCFVFLSTWKLFHLSEPRRSHAFEPQETESRDRTQAAIICLSLPPLQTPFTSSLLSRPWTSCHLDAHYCHYPCSMDTRMPTDDGWWLCRQGPAF